MARRTLKEPDEQPFVVRRSRIAGKGAFATRDIAKGERLVEYVGERLTHAEADERYDDDSVDAHHTFLFNVNRSVIIDAYFGGNDSRFINHSCNPNCESEIEKSRVYIDAIKNIRTGEELTYDYAYGRDGTETLEDETTLYVCRCGAKKCRHTILEPITRAERRKLEARARRHHHEKHAASRQGHRRD